MSHQPYSEWILSDHGLSEHQASQLREHLLSCNECSTLQTNWVIVESQLRTATQIAPASGFVTRFQQYKQEQIAIQHQRQAIKSLVIIALSILATFTAIIGWLFITGSFGQIIVSLVSTLTGSINNFILLRKELAQFLLHISPRITFLLTTSFIGWTVILLTIWSLSLWRFAHKGEIQK